MTLSLPDQKKNPTNLFLEAVFPLLTNNSNADIVYVCVCHHFCAALCGQGKRENTCSSSSGNGGPDARGPCSFLYSRRGRRWCCIILSLSLLYSRQSFAEREREKLRASNQTDVMFEGENEGKNKYHIQTHISIEKEDGKGAATDG